MSTRDPASIRVDAVVPVYNEQRVLEQNIGTLHAFLHAHLPYDWRIVIADNASTDRTLEVACALQRQLERVTVLHLDQKGRGRALRAAWLGSSADVVSYMDVDLSTDL
ncbi:MAG: glycosyl transferase, partial [Chloroflexota bacterium]